MLDNELKSLKIHSSAVKALSNVYNRTKVQMTGHVHNSQIVTSDNSNP